MPRRNERSGIWLRSAGLTICYRRGLTSTGEIARMVLEEFVYPIAENLDGVRVVTNDARICGRIKSAAPDCSGRWVDVRWRIGEASNIGSDIGSAAGRLLFAAEFDDFLTSSK